jgi:hypothetical protein
MRFIREKKSMRRKRLIHKTHKAIDIYRSIFDDPYSINLLTKQCQAFWSIYGGKREIAKSFWINSSDTPQCYLEYFAQQCALYHCGENYLGAEYWVQSRSGKSTDSKESDGLAFHFDKDEVAFSSTGVWRHPSHSTVTYLDPSPDGARTLSTPAQWGAPIIIFETKSLELPPGLKPISPTRLTPSHAWITFPRPGVHLRFDGNLLHGVASELNSLLYSDETGEYHRLSLAVNLWVKGKPPPMGLQRIDAKLVNESSSSTLASTSTTRYPRCFTRQHHQQQDLLQRMNLRRVVIERRETSHLEEEDAPGEVEYLVTDLGTLVNEDDSDNNRHEEVYHLKEHLDGDTGVIPLVCLRREVNQIRTDARYRSRSNGVRIRYS